MVDILPDTESIETLSAVEIEAAQRVGIVHNLQSKEARKMSSVKLHSTGVGLLRELDSTVDEKKRKNK